MSLSLGLLSRPAGAFVTVLASPHIQAATSSQEYLDFSASDYIVQDSESS